MVLFRRFLAICIVRKPLGEMPYGLIQFPEPPLRRAIRGFKSSGLWHCFEVLFIRLIADGILSQWSFLVFDGERITMEPNNGGMASQCLFSIEFPSSKMDISQSI